MVVKIDLEGKQNEENPDFKKIKVSDDVHDGTIKDIVLLEGTNFDTGAKEPKIVLNVEIAEGVVSRWDSPKVTKGVGTYSPSNLYVTLEKAGLLEDFKQYAETIKSEEQLTTYFNEKLSGKKVKILTKTVQPKDKEKEPYSKIEKVISIE